MNVPAYQAGVRPQSISIGAAFALGLGLALYQLTSLTLGPAAAARVLNISLEVPAVDLQEVSDPLFSDVKLVIGSGFQARLLSMVAPLVTAHGTRAVAGRSSSAPMVSPSSTTPQEPAPVAAVGKAKTAAKSHYHDADERSLRLARRR